MADLKELSVLGKTVMSGVVEAEMLGLRVVREYLGLAFDEVAREAAELRAAMVKAGAETLLAESGEGVGGS